MRKSKKLLLVLLIPITIVVGGAILFVSPITKYLIEKYDERFVGRQIKVRYAYVNPFTGYVHLDQVQIYEFKSDSLFFSAEGISLKLTICKLFFKTYEIKNITFNRPQFKVIQNKKTFNFNDLIAKFSADTNAANSTTPIHFNILNIAIIDGEFHYHENEIPISYFIKNVYFDSKGYSWNEDTVAANFSFLSGMGSGEVKGDFAINIKKMEYQMAIAIHKFDLNIIDQYLKDLTNYGQFAAILDADINTKGNFNDKEDVTTRGLLRISNFHFGKNLQDDYLSFDKLVIAIHELSPKKHAYSYDSASLTRPYFKYELYDHLDNIQMIFGKNVSNLTHANIDTAKFNLVIEIANHIKVISSNLFKSNYKINKLAIYDGHIKFNDYSINEKFSVELSSLNMVSNLIEKSHQRVNISLKSSIKPYGNLKINLSINPKDSSNFDLHYSFQKIPITLLNPYTISYTSFPLKRGTIEINGNWKVKNGEINSTNHLLIIDPKITKRMLNKKIRWIPMRLLMPLIRERGNVIDYEIPITDNLKNPSFHLKNVVLDLVQNIFVKPPTTPYRIVVKHVETEIEQYHSFQWYMRDIELTQLQKKMINKLANYLEKNPNATITISPYYYALKEKEQILFFEAKKKYYLEMNNKNTHSFTVSDSEKVNIMSVKDSLFVNYLNRQKDILLLFTIEEKCVKYIGWSVVNIKYNYLNSQRRNIFLQFFKDKKVEQQIVLKPGKSSVPYNGFSFYKIEYNGEPPKSLVNAYRTMNELDEITPKKSLCKKRRKIHSQSK
jgi:hypothetical protein